MKILLMIHCVFYEFFVSILYSGFQIDKHLLDIIKNILDLFFKPAKDRVQYELMKLF